MVSHRAQQQSQWDHLMQCIANITRMAEMDRVRVSCVVLDSIAAACGDHRGEAVVRAPLIAAVFTDLKRLAAIYGFPVLVSNHVVSTMQGDALTGSGGAASYLPNLPSGQWGSEKPALGLAWGSIPNTRVMLSRSQVVAGARSLRVVSSSFLPDASVEYHITQDGVVA
eukprot:TRINITY_DN45425_c0_g1_i1.p1 TRINITY_DN45425_c0_g1~~TRINITY_DN45425_c0_g1_i1.p1  ORF type:complete len:176 (+),score=52.14 TRINITY_DN45425_c0_g1_i1:25-528(+)